MRNAIKLVVALGLLFALFLLGAGTWVFLPRQEARLAGGEEQSFGFFDPHLHIAVVGVERPETWDARSAEGEFRLVRVRARNSATEMQISIETDDLIVLALNGPGSPFAPLDGATGSGLATDLSARIAPGAAVTRTFLFDLPPGADATLSVSYGAWLGRFIPDHANGFLRRRIVFDLNEPTPSPRRAG